MLAPAAFNRRSQAGLSSVFDGNIKAEAVVDSAEFFGLRVERFNAGKAAAARCGFGWVFTVQPVDEKRNQ